MPRTGLSAPRACTPAELPGLVAAASEIFGVDMGEAFPLLFSPRNLRHLRVIADGGRMLAHAGFCLRRAVTPDGAVDAALFGAVFTLPELRGRGLASAVLADAIACARAAGAAAALVSGAGPFYERAGFRRCAPVPRWWVPAARGLARSPGITVAPAAARDLDLLASLHAAEPTRFVRDEGDWRALFTARRALWRRGSVWLVAAPGAHAYLVAEDDARESPGLGHVRRVVEAAGDRALVADGAMALAAQLGVPALELVIGIDGPWAREASRRAFAHDVVKMPLSEARWNGPDTALPWYGLDYV